MYYKITDLFCKVNKFYKKSLGTILQRLSVCSSKTLPKALHKKVSFNYFKDKYKIDNFYSWTLSIEGKALIENLQRNVKSKIKCISRM